MENTRRQISWTSGFPRDFSRGMTHASAWSISLDPNSLVWSGGYPLIDMHLTSHARQRRRERGFECCRLMMVFVVLLPCLRVKYQQTDPSLNEPQTRNSSERGPNASINSASLGASGNRWGPWEGSSGGSCAESATDLVRWLFWLPCESTSLTQSKDTQGLPRIGSSYWATPAR